MRWGREWSIMFLRAVKEKKNEEIVGHIPDPLAKIFHPLLKSCKVYEIAYTVTNKVIKKALKGTWVLGGVIKLPLGYIFYGPKIKKRRARD